MRSSSARPRPQRTGVATVFGDRNVRWRGQGGELEITEVRVLGHGERSDLATASGHYRLQVQGAAGTAPCTISGSFKNGTFKLRH